MKQSKRSSLFLYLALLGAIIMLLPLAAIAQNDRAVEADSDETLQEQSLALAAEQEGATPASIPATLQSLLNVDYPLFVGVDDTTIPAYQIDPATSNAIQAFIGGEVWGAAFDEVNNIVYFNSGSSLYEWPVGGAINLLGTIVDGGGATQSMVGLAFYDGQLYATKNIANEAIWAVDTNTLVATVHIDYVDADLDCGGFAADPNTGTFYCANDDAAPYGTGLVIINPDASVTTVAAYPDGQTDIDGLAVSDDGYAYLVIDEPGSIYVYDLVGGAYTTPLTNPWTTSEVFSAGTWIWEPLQGGQCPAGPEVGELTVDDPTFNRPTGFGGSCLPSGVGTNVYYDVYSYDMSGPAPHDLFASLVDGTTMDTVLVFYQAPDGSANPFDPAQPCLNSVAYNDDFGGTLQSQISATDLGTGWVDVVVTTFGNDTTGAYTMDVSSQSCQAPLTDARLAVAHLAPFAMDPGTAVTITLNATPVLTNFAYGDSTAYLTVAPGSYDVEVYPAGSPTPAMSGTFTLTGGVDYSVIATGDGSNQPLELLALVDDNSAPAAGNFKLRLGHLAPFAAGPATADIRLQDGTPVLTDVNFGDVAPYLELPAGTYDLKITTPGGATTLIDLLPVTFANGDIVTAFATGEGNNQALGAFAWPTNSPGFFLPLASAISVDPAAFDVTVTLGDSLTLPLTVTNSGGAPLTFQIYEQDGGSMPTLHRATGLSQIGSEQSQSPEADGGMMTLSGPAPGTRGATAVSSLVDPWMTVSPAPQAVSRPAGAVVDGLFYVVGGESTGGVRLGQVQIYDPGNDTWDNLSAPTMPIPVSNLCAAALDGVIYVPGGYTGVVPETALQVFDPVANSWSVSATDPLPAGRFASACASHDGKLYLFGGSDGAAATTTAWVYDPAADPGSRWEALPDAPFIGAYGAALSVNGLIFYGGVSDNLSGNFSDVAAYDPVSNSWITYPSLQVGRGGAGMWAVGNTLYIGGGGWSTYLTSVEAYDTTLGTGGSWEFANSLNQGRRTFAYATDAENGHLYAATGWAGAFLTHVEKSNFLTLTDVPWLSQQPITGTVAAGETAVIDITFDASLPITQTGQYFATMVFLNNSPEDVMMVPITMTVQEIAYLQVAHLAPFAADASVTVEVNGMPALTDFNYGDSTGYMELPAGMYTIEIIPTGSITPAITAMVELMGDTYYSAIATGDGVNQPLALVALVDDNSAPAAGTFKLRLGHLAPFAAGDALADIRLQDGTPVLTDVAYADITGYLELPAGEYDLKITTPGGGTMLIDPLPVAFADGDIITAFATGEGSNQALGVFAWPPDTMGFFLPLFEGYTLYLPLVLQP